jgi:hypothetical protein
MPDPWVLGIWIQQCHHKSHLSGLHLVACHMPAENPGHCIKHISSGQLGAYLLILSMRNVGPGVALQEDASHGLDHEAEPIVIQGTDGQRSHAEPYPEHLGNILTWRWVPQLPERVIHH